MSKEERTVHSVKLFKNPCWIKARFIGKYEGIKFSLVYREYQHEETEEIAKAYTFKWPGRIPENKEVAEEGIKALFERVDLDYTKVISDGTDVETEIEEQDLLQNFIEEQIEEIDEALQEGQ